MTVFIVTGFIMAVSVGGFMSLIFTSGMKDDWKRVVACILISLAIGFSLSGLFALERKSDEMTWNNGHCKECNGEWNLVDVERTKNSSNLYYYECEDCHNIIRTHSNFR